MIPLGEKEMEMEVEMSKPGSPKKTTAWARARPIMAVQRSERRSELRHPHEMRARKSWVAAVRIRKAAQERIVCAFRRHIEGWGSGPTDAQLLMFARAAIAEQRCKRALARAMLGRRRRHAQAPIRPVSVLRREYIND